jgi:hypothetical protein
MAKFSGMGYLLAGVLFAANAIGADLTLYTDDDYQGRALGVVIDERALGVLNFDKRASSVVVENSAWILCTGEEYTGQCITLEPGRYASLQALGLDNAVTSVRRRDAVSVGVFKDRAAPNSSPADAAGIVLYASKDYRGPSHSVDRPRSDLRVESLQAEATSAVIASGKWELCEDAEFRGPCVTLGPGKYPSLGEFGLKYGAVSVRRAAQSQDVKPPGN